MIIKFFKIKKYYESYKEMLNFNKNRYYLNDQIWFLENYSSFTCGTYKNNIFVNKNIINKKNIPIYFNDRGGGIVYHDKGQQIIYTLINIKNFNFSIKNFIFILEDIIINFLLKIKIVSHRINGMNGVYINNKKICFIGLKIKNYIIYYGLALNIKMNLLPFSYIYTCGYNIKITQISDVYKNICFKEISYNLSKYFFKIINKYKKT